LHRLIKAPFGLLPRSPRLRRHAAGVAATLFALRDFAVGPSGVVSLPLSPLSLAMHNALELSR